MNARVRMDSSSDGCGSAFSCLPFFVAGILVIVLVEFLLVLYLLQRLLNMSSANSPVKSDLKIQSEEVEEDYSISLQGNAWVAPVPEDMELSKVIVKQIRKDKKKEKDGGQREAKLEIAPMRRHAILNDKTLLLRASDGTIEEVSLEGCEVLTVSSSPGESRKWGKKFPIKLHHRDRVLYRGCKTFLFYAQSGYAKEAWCEAFRAMAGRAKAVKTFETKRKYREYTHAAEENMPFLTKFYAVDEEEEARLQEVKHNKEQAAGASRTRTMWRKLARKASLKKDYKETRFAHTVDDTVHRRKQPTRTDDKAWRNNESAFYDEACAPAVVDPNFDRATSFEKLENGTDPVKDNHRETGDQEKARNKPKEGKEIEPGVLCLNMIVARLYYDFNQSQRRLASVDRFFQRLLMKIRKPSYIKSITIKELDLGRHPPFATAIRILPSDAAGALAMEMDLEWHGGGHLTCETRLDLREQSTQGEVAAQLAESGSEGDVTAAVLSGLRGDFDSEVSSASFSAAVQEGRHADLPNKKGRWMQSVKSMVSRVADKASQVPLVLKIRLVSLKGTAVFKLKAPPSDRVWFAFKTMPDIHFEPEPCIGEHRISNNALARLIANQIKVQIRESVVLPYCEDFFLNWMMADKDNWLPLSTFPFPFFDSQSSEAERETFKQIAETHSSSSDESGRHGHQPGHQPQATNRNAQTKPPKGQACKTALSSPFKSQKLHVGRTSAQLQPRRSSSDLFSSQVSVPKPPRASSSVHLSALGSAPVQTVSASTALSLASPLLSKESSSAFMRPKLLKNGESQAWESARDLDLVTLRTAMESRPKDWSSHSEGSASDSDVQFLANQVANPEDVKELDQSSKITRRSRMSSLGKKVVEKMHHKRPDDIDA